MLRGLKTSLGKDVAGFNREGGLPRPGAFTIRIGACSNRALALRMQHADASRNLYPSVFNLD